MPRTLQMMFVGRVKGEQSINQAEATALSLTIQVPNGFGNIDSNYAINTLHSHLASPALSHLQTIGNHHANLQSQDLDRIRNIKAH